VSRDVGQEPIDAPDMRYFRWLIGALLSFFGITMVVGYIADQFSGESTTSWLFNLGFVSVVGLVPLTGGLMLLLAKPRPLGRDDSA
jgi:hypothetical protein